MIHCFKTLLTFLFVLFSLLSFGQELYLPAFDSTDQIIRHYAFTLQYNEEYEQADWVAYELTSNECIPRVKRSDNFKSDPKVITSSAEDEDYKGSGYDRGHIAPAADMAWDLRAMHESFFYSNMSPQDPSFNRGIWKKLEAQVRSWAMHYRRVQVVSGPIIENPYSSIGPNEVAIPQYYYKALLIEQDSSYLSLAFILPNQRSSDGLETFIVSVNDLESRTKIDFFPLLPDSIEEQVEAQKDPKLWNWESEYDFESAPSESIAERCKGTTLTGRQCKNRTRHESGYCHHHRDQENTQPASETSQCTATTQSGSRCKRTTKDSSGRCWQHQ
ncbi:MAG: DNA/RNA endonuclease [Flavobacteriales bacterium]|nr:DNA/RNA endonuclease [Flavobacteriales bacterium]